MLFVLLSVQIMVSVVFVWLSVDGIVSVVFVLLSVEIMVSAVFNWLSVDGIVSVVFDLLSVESMVSMVFVLLSIERTVSGYYFYYISRDNNKCGICFAVRKADIIGSSLI